jgi:hypothetical protein
VDAPRGSHLARDAREGACSQRRMVVVGASAGSAEVTPRLAGTLSRAWFGDCRLMSVTRGGFALPDRRRSQLCRAATPIMWEKQLRVATTRPQGVAVGSWPRVPFHTWRRSWRSPSWQIGQNSSSDSPASTSRSAISRRAQSDWNNRDCHPERARLPRGRPAVLAGRFASPVRGAKDGDAEGACR